MLFGTSECHCEYLSNNNRIFPEIPSFWKDPSNARVWPKLANFPLNCSRFERTYNYLHLVKSPVFKHKNIRGAEAHFLYDSMFIFPCLYDEHLYMDTYAILSLVDKEKAVFRSKQCHK